MLLTDILIIIITIYIHQCTTISFVHCSFILFINIGIKKLLIKNISLVVQFIRLESVRLP